MDQCTDVMNTNLSNFKDGAKVGPFFMTKCTSQLVPSLDESKDRLPPPEGQWGRQGRLLAREGAQMCNLHLSKTKQGTCGK